MRVAIELDCQPIGELFPCPGMMRWAESQNGELGGDISICPCLHRTNDLVRDHLPTNKWQLAKWLASKLQLLAYEMPGGGVCYSLSYWPAMFEIGPALFIKECRKVGLKVFMKNDKWQMGDVYVVLKERLIAH